MDDPLKFDGRRVAWLALAALLLLVAILALEYGLMTKPERPTNRPGVREAVGRWFLGRGPVSAPPSRDRLRVESEPGRGARLFVTLPERGPVRC